MTPSFDRRQLLRWATAGALPTAWSVGHAATGPSHPALSLVTTWRGPAVSDPHRLGRFDLDPTQGTLRQRWAIDLPSRAHGLHPTPDAGLLLAAARPGRWLLRVGADGSRPMLRWLDDEPDAQRTDGHLLIDPMRGSLWTPQTDTQGRAWLARRDPHTLHLQHRVPAHGIDPHQLVLDGDGHLLLALGGITRAPDGRKIELDRMQSALVRLHGDSGALLGRWTLPDPRLSLRHLAWSSPATDEARRLGVALQAEHDDPVERAGAPLLAWWDGHGLHTALGGAPLAGYAGDIGAAPEGGFVLSAQSAGRAVAWSPTASPAGQTVALLHQACALAAAPDGAVWITAPAGVARWHPEQPPRLLRWPEPLLPDNHALLLPV